jgi:hypothetical protein
VSSHPLKFRIFGFNYVSHHVRFSNFFRTEQKILYRTFQFTGGKFTPVLLTPAVTSFQSTTPAVNLPQMSTIPAVK